MARPAAPDLYDIVAELIAQDGQRAIIEIRDYHPAFFTGTNRLILFVEHLHDI